jgi:hypothetical protein
MKTEFDKSGNFGAIKTEAFEEPTPWARVGSTSRTTKRRAKDASKRSPAQEH